MFTVSEEPFFYLVYEPMQTENYHIVTLLYVGIAVDEVALAVTHHCCECHLSWQVEPLDRLACYTGVGLHLQLCGIGIGKRQALGVLFVCIEQELEYIARSLQLLIDSRADVQVFGKADELQVFHVCNRLRHAELLGGQASEDVCFRRLRESEKSIILVHVVFLQHIHVAAVAADYLAVRQLCRHPLAMLAVEVNYLDMELVMILQSEAYSNRTSAHDHEPLDGAFGLAAKCAYLFDKRRRGDEIQRVSRHCLEAR